MKNTNPAEDRESRFSAALEAAIIREKGLHGSVGTQNEKLIHAALKNYYAPHSDEQEIKIGSYFADAVSEDGIFEIQTSSLHRLSGKLRAFSGCSHVTVVHPVISEYKTIFICSETGEIVRETSPRRIKSELKIFKELYSIREFLMREDLTVILCFLKAEKRVYFSGSELPNMKNKKERQKCFIEKIPTAVLDEKILEKPRDYACFIPNGLPAEFTKKQLSDTAKESRASFRTEILRTVGLIEKIGKNKNEYVYKLTQKGTENG